MFDDLGIEPEVRDGRVQLELKDKDVLAVGLVERASDSPDPQSPFEARALEAWRRHG